MSQKKNQETELYSGKDSKEKDKADKALKTICSNGDVTSELSEDQTSRVLCAPTPEALKNAEEKYNTMASERSEITEGTEINVPVQLGSTTTEIADQSKLPKNEDKNEKVDQTQAEAKHDQVNGSGTLRQHDHKIKEGSSEELKNSSVAKHEDEKRQNLEEGVQAKSIVKSDSKSKKESTIGRKKLNHTMSNDDTESANKMKDRQLEDKEISVKCDVCNIKDDASSVVKETVSKAFSFPDKVEIVSPEGFKIKIYQHDLLETNVDAIVNAANDKLSHGAGVAEAIAKRAGPDMTRECKDYIKKNKSLTVSKAFASSSGKLKFKKIIHVVGPAWWDYKDKVKCLNDLAKTITNLLEKAKECRVRTVAMPTISSGIFKVPQSLCAAMYLKGAFDFSMHNTFGSLQELHIVDLSPDVLVAVHETYNQYLTMDRVIDPYWLVSSHEKQESDTEKERLTDAQNSNSSKPTEKKQNIEKISNAKSVNANSEGNVNPDHFTKDIKNIRVFIYTQDLGSLEGIDVAVSCENPHFTGKGGIAATLLSKGGTTYANEHTNLRKNAPYPQFTTIISPGYNTNFKTICHAIIAAFSRTRPLSQACKMQYNSCIYSILREIDARSEQLVRTKKTKGFCSIVLPLLGAGTLQDQHSIQNLCTLMLKAIAKFAIHCPKQITQIHLVNMRDEFTKMLITNIRPMDSKHSLFKSGDANTKLTKFDSRPFKYIYNWRVLPREQTVKLKDIIKPVAEHNKGVCIICLDEMTKPVAFTKCHHCFCEECIFEYFTMKPACPVCNTVYGELYGSQPLNGEAHIFKDKRSLPGYPRTETFIINYVFPNGYQEECHPNPGEPFTGIERQAYLPDNSEGQEVLHLLEQAFKQRLVFTIGVSRTTGKEGVVTWNDIHHKTRRDGGPERFGYPDEDYLSRVKEELKAKGIVNA